MHDFSVKKKAKSKEALFCDTALKKNCLHGILLLRVKALRSQGLPLLPTVVHK